MAARAARRKDVFKSNAAAATTTLLWRIQFSAARVAMQLGQQQQQQTHCSKHSG